MYNHVRSVDIAVYLVFQNDDGAVFRDDRSGEIQEQIVEDVKGRNFHGTNDVLLLK